VLRWDGDGQEWTAVCRDGSGDLRAAAAGWGAQIVSERAPTLDELFFAHVGIHAASEADT
jgi:ABC-2 type transport system ATP-binding protein